MIGTFLGTGASSGIPVLNCNCKICTSSSSLNKRLRSSFFLYLNDTNILIDTGPDTRQQLLRENIKKIDAVLYTHEHYDHIMGLDDIKFFTIEKPLNIYARETTMNHIKNSFPHDFSKKTSLSRKVNIIPNVLFDYEKFSINEIDIIPIPLFHGDVISLGYRINNLAYITDIKSFPEKAYSYLENLDTLIIDALSIKPHPTHLNFEDAVNEVRKIKPTKVYFTHVSHEIMHEDYDYLKNENIYLAYDGLKIEI